MSYTFKAKNKDPQAVLDYELDLAANGWLAAGETITEKSATCASPDMTITDVTEAGGVIRFWVSGGEADTDYLVTVQFTTSAGRTDQRTIMIPVRDR